MVPAAHASDGGGWIRIPAAHCGLVGLKATRGRTSFGPGAGERWSGFSCELVVSRTVRDTAAILTCRGCMPGDPYSAAPPATFARKSARIGQLRMALFGSRAGRAVDPDVRAARNAAPRARALGHASRS
jgi:amidase